MGSPGEDVEVVALDLVQDPAVQTGGGLEDEPTIGGEQPDSRPTLMAELAVRSCAAPSIYWSFSREGILKRWVASAQAMATRSCEPEPSPG